MKIYKFNSLIIKDKMKYHDHIKHDLLNLINQASDSAFQKKDEYFGDDLLKSDWPSADDLENRPWAKKYKHLMGHETPSVLASKIVDTLRTDSNPEGLFLHPVSKQKQHLCFTGGEPLMVTGQIASVGIYEELKRLGKLGDTANQVNVDGQMLSPQALIVERNRGKGIVFDKVRAWAKSTAKRRLIDEVIGQNLFDQIGDQLPFVN